MYNFITSSCSASSAVGLSHSTVTEWGAPAGLPVISDAACAVSLKSLLSFS